MRLKWHLSVLFIFGSLFIWGQSPERPKREIPLLTDVLTTIVEAEGWMLQNNGEWISAKNKISFKDYALNKRKSGRYALGMENFERINIRSITINDVVYSVMLIYSQVGNYEFPLLEEKWHQYKAVSYFAFEESKWNSIFPDSITFNKPFAIDTETICNGHIIDYNDESYLFEIENDIRQAIYQREKSNSNMIFACYPVQIRKKTYFRFKMYETINKQEIYRKYLNPNNSQKIFENFYYEMDFDDFEKFVNNINTIDPSKIDQPDYYLSFIAEGIAKYRKEEYRSALQNFIKATMVNHPDSAMITLLMWKGKAKLQLRSYEEAIRDFDSAIDRSPATLSEKQDWIQAHYERGLAFHASHNYAEACKDWNFALQNGVAEAYRKIKKNCGKPADNMRMTIDIEQSEKHFRRAEKKYNHAKYLKALNLFEDAWEDNYLSQDFKLPYYIGLCRYHLGDYVRSIDEFDRAAKLEPEKFTGRYEAWIGLFIMKGKAWQQTGQTDKACESWLKAHNLGNAEALGLLEMNCKNVRFANQAESPVIATSLKAGIALFEAGDYARALQTLNRAEKLDTEANALLFYAYRGNARHKTGDYAGAIADFTSAIERGSGQNTSYYKEWVFAHFNRGVSRYLAGDIKGACLDWKNAVNLGLNDLDALEYISIYCGQ